MTLEIVTPDKKVFSGEINAVTFPGSGGQFQLLKDHAPIVSTLAQGDIVIEVGGKKESFVVDGGVLEVSNNNILVLAESIA